MSIKRTKQRTFSPRQRDDEISLNPHKPAEPDKSWEQHVAGQADDAFAPFSLKTRYAKGALLDHATFGKGVVLGAGPTVIEVLFKDGKKKLGHGMA
ncbi:MAG: hypothetical protein HY903_15955 [Deltaproteobacteria bacterium]|nr:hypothetical protein [Deltaproteobacteria bacterium]